MAYLRSDAWKSTPADIDDFGARFNRYLKYWNGLMADQDTPRRRDFDRRFCVYPVIYRAKRWFPRSGVPAISIVGTTKSAPARASKKAGFQPGLAE